MSTPPTISVLLTYFNEKELLTECIASLVKNGIPNEILVYDDASHYPAKEYLKPEWKVTVVRGEKNLGPGYGRNLLARQAKSQYIHFHDADDLFKPKWLEQVTGALKKEVDLVLTEANSFVESDAQREIYEDIVGYSELAASQDLLAFCLTGVILTPTTTIRKASFLAQNGFSESLKQSEDFDFFLRFAQSKPTFTVIAESLVTVRIRAQSRSSFKPKEFLNGAEIIFEAAKKFSPEYRALAGARLIDFSQKLHSQGAYKDSEHLIALARELGPLDLRRLSGPLQMLGKAFGLPRAFFLADRSRNVVPAKLKSVLHRLTR